MSLADQSVDLIFANLFLPWQQDISLLLKEWRRLLRADGLLLLSAWGLDTLQTGAVIKTDLIPHLIDMHDLGDALLAQGFADPVLDVQHYTLAYRDHTNLLQELCISGMRASRDPDPSLSLSAQGTWDLVYEVIYAHAFAPAEQHSFSPLNKQVRVPLSSIKRSG
jgi:malonyl-CoA O-methyltransferase